MTPNERRWSLLIDLITVVIALGTLSLLAGCHRIEDTPETRGGTTEKASGVVDTGTPGLVGSSLERAGGHIVVDTHTGCEYLAHYSHGLTPRMSKQGGNYHQMGCK